MMTVSMSLDNFGSWQVAIGSLWDGVGNGLGRMFELLYLVVQL